MNIGKPVDKNIEKLMAKLNFLATSARMLSAKKYKKIIDDDTYFVIVFDLDNDEYYLHKIINEEK